MTRQQRNSYKSLFDDESSLSNTVTTMFYSKISMKTPLQCSLIMDYWNLFKFASLFGSRLPSNNCTMTMTHFTVDMFFCEEWYCVLEFPCLDILSNSFGPIQHNDCQNICILEMYFCLHSIPKVVPSYKKLQWTTTIVATIID